MKKICLIAALFLAACGGSSPDNKPAGQQSAQKEVYKTTAQQLYKDYEANEVAADEKMKGKLIEISGTVDSIDKDAFDNIVVHLKTGDAFSAAMVGMKDSEKQKAIALKKGAKITATCESSSRVMGSPALQKCVLP